jgi:hypothetical protein
MNRLIIEPPGLQVNKSGQLYAAFPTKWAKLMGSSAFEPLFFGSGGSMIIMARVLLLLLLPLFLLCNLQKANKKCDG